MLITDKILGDKLEGAEVAGRSLWKDARRRYLRNKAAVFFTIVLILIALFTVFGPLIAVTDHETIDFSMIGRAAQSGQPSISNGHYFGYDDQGRDLYSRVIQGTWISLLVGVVGAAVAVVIGTLYGAIAGYFGGRVDSIMMRIVDILMAIPFMFVLILLLVTFERSIAMLFVGIGMLSWLGMARIVRGQTISIKNKEFIEAAQASGVGSFTIILRHIVPNLLGVVTVYATLLVPEMILTESFISFVGLGVQPPDTSLGQLINVGAGNLHYGTIWQFLFPLGFFVVLIFSLFFVGDGLRDALDPKDR
ncbi:MAG: ABC transporter permease subunit [Paracoccaceae bacterium]